MQHYAPTMAGGELSSFRRLAVVTIAATFVLIAVGGLVRATD